MKNNLKIGGVILTSVVAGAAINHFSNGKVPAILIAVGIFGSVFYAIHKWGEKAPIPTKTK